MHFQNNPSPADLSTPRTQRQIILIKDNREPNTQEKNALDFRCSAFKDTEEDPLQGAMREAQIESLEGLAKRVTRLEERVNELVDLEEGMRSNRQPKSRKNRRKMSEMVREFQCPLCPKLYGSDTALKKHMKTKHEQAGEEAKE